MQLLLRDREAVLCFLTNLFITQFMLVSVGQDKNTAALGGRARETLGQLKQRETKAKPTPSDDKDDIHIYIHISLVGHLKSLHLQ